MKQADLFIGRLQPPHIGHQQIFDRMTNPIIVLVKGKKSSENKKRNPLSLDYQLRLLTRMAPTAKIVVSEFGYLPDIVAQLRKEKIEVTRVFAGADRFDAYQKQFEKAEKMTIKFVKTDRVTSATAVRAAIRDGNFEKFRELMPTVLHREWDKMTDLITQEENIKSFRNWLEEDPVVTADVARGDAPLFRKKMRIRRKKKNID